MIPDIKLSYYNFYIPYKEKDIYIVYNSLANSMIQLDWETGFKVQHLNSMEVFRLDREVIELLKRNRMIVASNLNEFEEIKKTADNKRIDFQHDETLFILFSPTNMCNMSCPYCYEGDKSSKTLDSKHMTRENINAAKEFVIKRLNSPHASSIKKIYIQWFGGEPLLQTDIIEELSEFILEQIDERSLDFYALITTNGYLLNKKTWDLLEKCRIYELQITIDGNRDMHNSMRFLKNGKGSYDTILENVSLMPKDKFKVIIRINGDKEVFKNVSSMFDDFTRMGLWPQRAGQIGFHWAPKFFNFEGFNQEMDIYYTSYEYHKSREDFAKLRVSKYNDWAMLNNKKTKKLKVAYPQPSKFYCNTVESPNSFSLDSSCYIYKCYNNVNDKKKRIIHINDFNKHDKPFELFNKLDKTTITECSTCKVLPICEETCNRRMIEKAESKICSAWNYFLNERMIAIYEQQFAEAKPSLEATVENGNP